MKWKKILRLSCWGIFLIHFFRYGFKIFYPICCSCKRCADSSTLYRLLEQIHIFYYTRQETKKRLRNVNSQIKLYIIFNNFWLCIHVYSLRNIVTISQLCNKLLVVHPEISLFYFKHFWFLKIYMKLKKKQYLVSKLNILG